MVVDEENPIYKIRSRDGQIIMVEEWLVQKSECLSVFFNLVRNPQQPVQVNVSNAILEKIVEWCYHHRDEDSAHDYPIVPLWDTHFLRTNNGIIFHLIEGAFRLGIGGLLDIACRAVASTLGRTPNEVRDMLRVGGFDEEVGVAEENLDADNGEWAEAISAA